MIIKNTKNKKHPISYTIVDNACKKPSKIKVSCNHWFDTDGMLEELVFGQFVWFMEHDFREWHSDTKFDMHGEHIKLSNEEKYELYMKWYPNTEDNTFCQYSWLDKELSDDLTTHMLRLYHWLKSEKPDFDKMENDPDYFEKQYKFRYKKNYEPLLKELAEGVEKPDKYKDYRKFEIEYYNLKTDLMTMILKIRGALWS